MSRAPAFAPVGGEVEGEDDHRHEAAVGARHRRSAGREGCEAHAIAGVGGQSDGDESQEEGGLQSRHRPVVESDGRHDQHGRDHRDPAPLGRQADGGKDDDDACRYEYLFHLSHSRILFHLYHHSIRK